MWDAAQEVSAEHATSRDDLPGDAPRVDGRRTYVLRSWVRCKHCGKRMSGATRFSTHYYKPGTPDVPVTYYRCPHDSASPRQVAANPDHPRNILVREDALLAAITQFCDERIFGPERATLLAAAYPADTAARASKADAEAVRLRKKLAQVDKAQDAHAAELLALATSGADPRAITAMRERTLAALTRLSDDRDTITRQLDTLTASTEDGPGNPALLDGLPRLAGRLAGAPPRLLVGLLDALNINAVYSREHHRVTIYATLTRSTPQALAALIADSHPTSPAPGSRLSSPPC
jgi:hypothetical protein